MHNLKDLLKWSLRGVNITAGWRQGPGGRARISTSTLQCRISRSQLVEPGAARIWKSHMCGTKLEQQDNGYNCKVGYKYTPRGGARTRERGDGLLPSTSEDGTTARTIQGRACYVHDERVGTVTPTVLAGHE